MTDDTYLCDVQDIEEGTAKEIFRPGAHGGIYLLLMREGAEVVAFHNECPHQGRPLNWAPDKFLFDKSGNLVCAAHGAVFDPRDGSCLSGPCAGASLVTAPVRVVEHEVHLFPEPEPAAESANPTPTTP